MDCSFVLLQYTHKNKRRIDRKCDETWPKKIKLNTPNCLYQRERILDPSARYMELRPVNLHAKCNLLTST